MVYNALKLFMEINPDLFDESMQHYKQRKIEYGVSRIYIYMCVLILFTVNANMPWTVTSSGKRCEKKR
jgi:serine/threonine-protein phosphatase 2A regulatory subunit B'